MSDFVKRLTLPGHHRINIIDKKQSKLQNAIPIYHTKGPAHRAADLPNAKFKVHGPKTAKFTSRKRGL